jgi:uncharacterized protein with FMN-binding domain
MNKSSITKYIVGAVIIVAVVAYIIFTNQSSTPNTVATTPVTSEPTSTDIGTGSTTTATGTTATTGQYKDGTYTGTVADAFYGNLQVAAVISGGMITDIQFVQAPSGGNSTNVSNQAEPVLKQEAIATQSANVNTVSGATQDTVAFNQSLAAALAQAKN